MASPKDQGTVRTLLVEDNADDAAYFEEILTAATDQRFELVWAKSVEEGAQRIEAGGVDLVLLDLGLPGTSGLDTFEKFRRVARHVPIVVLTGLDDRDIAITALQWGAQDYLPKGRTDAELLRRTVRYAVERHKLLMGLMDALDQVKALRGLLPICTECKKIRNDKGYWEQVEEYIEKNSLAEFSHSICPDCMEQLYPDLCAGLRRKGKLDF